MLTSRSAGRLARRTILVAALMLATTALPVAPATPLDDDAGSGRDAGWGRGDSVRVQRGTHHGTLTSFPDRVDAFVVHAERGMVLRVDAEARTFTGHGTPRLMVKVLDPLDRWSPWGATDGGPSRPSEHARYVPLSGDWLILVTAASPSGNPGARVEYALTITLTEPDEEDAVSGGDAGEADRAVALPDGTSHGFLHAADHADEYRFPVRAGETFHVRVASPSKSVPAILLDADGRMLARLDPADAHAGELLWTAGESGGLILRIGWPPVRACCTEQAGVYGVPHDSTNYSLTLTREDALPPGTPRPVAPVLVDLPGEPRDVATLAEDVAVAATSGLWMLEADGRARRVLTASSYSVAVDGDGDLIAGVHRENASSPHRLEHVHGDEATPVVSAARAITGPGGFLIENYRGLAVVNESRGVQPLDWKLPYGTITRHWAYDAQGALHLALLCPDSLFSALSFCKEPREPVLVRVDVASGNLTRIMGLPASLSTFTFAADGDVYYSDGNGRVFARDASTNGTRLVGVGVLNAQRLAVTDGKLWFVDVDHWPWSPAPTSRLGYLPLDVSPPGIEARPFTPDPLPDWAVTRVEVHPETRIGLETAGRERQEVTAVVENVGDGWMPGGVDLVFEARCLPAAGSACEDETFRTMRLDGLPQAGESVTYTTTWDRTLRAGDYEIVVTLQPRQGVFETDASNNAASTTTSVRVTGTGSLL